MVDLPPAWAQVRYSRQPSREIQLGSARLELIFSSLTGVREHPGIWIVAALRKVG
jgi:hypothetical protein